MVDDHPLFRKGLIKHLDPNQYEVLFDVSDGAELIEKIKESVKNIPDVIIMDIEMRVLNNYETVDWLKSNYSNVNILVLSVVDNEELVVRMFRLCVKGYLSKVMDPEDFHATLNAFSIGEYYFTAIVTNRLVYTIFRKNKTQDGKRELIFSHELWDSLNPRQRE